MDREPAASERPVTENGAPNAQPAPHAASGHHHQSLWLWVMCLTGVDYFSTLGYQPSIAFDAAGILAPIATVVLVLITLFGALPVYCHVASSSPHGQGSIAMLERLVHGWTGKIMVLALLGFAATDFVITMTLSSADAAAHILPNPIWKNVSANWTWFPSASQQLGITMFLLMLLGASFMRGFKEVIGIAVTIVAVYLFLNLFVIGAGVVYLLAHPALIEHWYQNLMTGNWHLHAHDGSLLPPAQNHGWLTIIGLGMLYFPKLALGLSGFETGVAVMPLIQGDPTDDPHRPAVRIRNTRKLLTLAAVIMSFGLLGSSMITATLIAPEALNHGGPAADRALAFIAHGETSMVVCPVFGELFGTIYDISTITILWFAGASALAGLLNIVPRFLPRYGMAPSWTRAHRPLVLVFMVICFLVTLTFRADVDAQAGAYATGVLAVITSASVAVALAARRERDKRGVIYFGIVALLFIYTTIVTIVEDSEGLQIALMFIATIVVVSLISRSLRSTELRASSVSFDDTAMRFLESCEDRGELRIIANHPDDRTSREYLLKEREEREASNIPAGTPVVFLEVTVADASEFAPSIQVSGQQIGEFRILRAVGASIPNTIAAVLLAIRDETGCRPHAYFGWTEGNPLKFLARFIFFGEGDIAPVTHEVLRKAEPDPKRRPAIHVG